MNTHPQECDYCGGRSRGRRLCTFCARKYNRGMERDIQRERDIHNGVPMPTLDPSELRAAFRRGRLHMTELTALAAEHRMAGRSDQGSVRGLDGTDPLPPGERTRRNRSNGWLKPLAEVRS